VNFWDPWGWEGTPTVGDHVAEFWNSFGRNICHSACVVSDSGEQEDRNWPTAVRSEGPITSDAEIEDRVNEVLEDREFIADTTESGLVNNQENFFTELFAGIFGMRRGSGSALSEALEEPTGPRGRARTPNEETEAAATARASTVRETEAAAPPAPPPDVAPPTGTTMPGGPDATPPGGDRCAAAYWRGCTRQCRRLSWRNLYGRQVRGW
jgi:hypothetical protein